MNNNCENNCNGLRFFLSMNTKISERDTSVSCVEYLLSSRKTFVNGADLSDDNDLDSIN